MKGFAGIDYVVVVGYLMINALIGSSFYRRKTTPEDYFLGGRCMRWLPVGISIIAADMSARIFLPLSFIVTMRRVAKPGIVELNLE